MLIIPWKKVCKKSNPFVTVLSFPVYGRWLNAGPSTLKRGSSYAREHIFQAPAEEELQPGYRFPQDSRLESRLFGGHSCFLVQAHQQVSRRGQSHCVEC